MPKLKNARTPGFLLLGVFFMVCMISVELGGSYDAATSMFSSGGGWFKQLSNIFTQFKGGSADSVDTGIDDFKGLEGALDQKSDDPPGYGIASLMYVDALVLFTYIMMALPMAISPNVVAKLQGLVTIIVALITIVLALLFILEVLVRLMLMLLLLLAIPFGTIIYMIVYADFDTTKAAAIMAALMSLKIAGAICLPIAHEMFLKNFGAILLIGTSFITMIILSFLHNFIPFFLVSITDCIAALIIALIAIIWAIILLISGLISVIKLIVGLKDSLA